MYEIWIETNYGIEEVVFTTKNRELAYEKLNKVSGNDNVKMSWLVVNGRVVKVKYNNNSKIIPLKKIELEILNLLKIRPMAKYEIKMKIGIREDDLNNVLLRLKRRNLIRFDNVYKKWKVVKKW